MFQQDGAAGPVGDLVYNNTINMASDGRWDLVVSSSVGGNTVRDNIFYNENSGHGGIQYTDATDVANTDSDYNIFGGGNFAITPDDGNTFLTLAEWQSQAHEAHSFLATLASLFVNPSAGNYQLLAGSPAIDKGQTLATVTVDLAGDQAAARSRFRHWVLRVPRLMLGRTAFRRELEGLGGYTTSDAGKQVA